MATFVVSKWRKVSHELTFRLGRVPSISEVANELEIPEETWAVLKQTIHTSALGPEVSLDALTMHQDVVEDTRAASPDAEITQTDLLRRLGELLGSLDERESTIVRLRYGLDQGAEPMTLKEIGKVVGLPRERVRQIERDVLRRLHRVMDEGQGSEDAA